MDRRSGYSIFPIPFHSSPTFPAKFHSTWFSFSARLFVSPMASGYGSARTTATRLNCGGGAQRFTVKHSSAAAISQRCGTCARKISDTANPEATASSKLKEVGWQRAAEARRGRKRLPWIHTFHPESCSHFPRRIGPFQWVDADGHSSSSRSTDGTRDRSARLARIQSNRPRPSIFPDPILARKLGPRAARMST